MEINKKVLASVFIISMLAFAMGYGTMSYFSDKETSSGNSFTAGTLDLKVDGHDDGGATVPVYFKVDNVKPSDSGSKDIVLSNAGTLEGKAYIHFTNVLDDEGDNPEPETEGKLSENLYIIVSVGAETKVQGYLSDIECTDYELGTIGEGLTVTISWSISKDVGNGIMGDIVTFDIEFSLKQA
jgi:predicted ribosomally synthesized peptide with SipW-like signal peptide